MDRIPSFLVTSVTLVMGVATAMLSITVPSLWSMAGDIGAVKARVETFDRRFNGIDKRLEAIEGKVDAVAKRADGIEARLVQRETDTSALVAQSGLRPESEFGGLRVGQKLFVLPKSDKAALDLASSGLQREAITPSTFGYVIGTFDDAGRLQTSGTGMTGSGGSMIRR